MDEIAINVTDPLGFEHRVLMKGGRLFGTENLMHVEEDPDLRQIRLAELLPKLLAGSKGKWAGFSWRRDEYSAA